MSTKAMLTAVERYLGAQMACENAANEMRSCAADQEDCLDGCLRKARADLEAHAASPTAPGIHKILVAVDHEHHPALQAALKIAQPLRAQIAIVYVQEPLPAPSIDTAIGMAAMQEQVRADAAILMARLQTDIPATALAYTVLRNGPAAAEILAAAEEFHADLIIMGTHRRGALARFFLGSVSQAVLRNAPCAVMFVNDNAPVAESQPALQHA